ncbi:MAG: ABC transporter permease [Clostridiaceae bacterium]|jgi:simple sugar transport system permease protein|nr:ABC transporter permease [Clostridiaceae bacterium]
MNEVANFIATSVRLAAPTLLAGLGLVFSERAGIVNIGTEGLMLIGALAGVMGSLYTGNVWLGTLIAILITVLFAAVFAFFTVIIKADQTVIGTGLNLLASGLTITINRAVFGANTSPPKIDTFKTISLPVLSDIPYLGKMFFQHKIPIYLAFLLVPLAQFMMFRSNTGLKVRSVGENPKACDTVGINVAKARFLAILYSGVMAGFAGAFVSMGQLSFFTEGMIAGGGFIALAAVVFGNYTPVGVMLASLVFGASNSLMYRLQTLATGVPSQFPLMIPYIITIVSLCFVSRKSNKPAGSAIPYIKE